MINLKKILIFVLSIVMALSLFACSKTETATETTTTTEIASSESSTLPEPLYMHDLELVDLDGNIRTIKEFEGKPILINLWASWCQYCVEEMPFLKELHEKGEIVILAVNVAEPLDKVKTYIDTEKLEFPVFTNGEELLGLFGGQGIPMNIFIGADGELYYVHPGLINEEIYTAIMSAIQKYLEEGV